MRRSKKTNPTGFHRRKHSSGQIEVLLDENERAKGQTYFQIDTLQLNPRNKLMAWLEDIQGQERLLHYIQDLHTKVMTSGRSISPTSSGLGMAWMSMLYTFVEITPNVLVASSCTTIWIRNNRH